MFKLHKKSCYGLEEIPDNSIHAVVTDPPYGISLEEWDKFPEDRIWEDCFRVMKPGAFLLCFSSIRFQHVFTQKIEQAGFALQDVLIWAYLNGRVPAQDVAKSVDKLLGNEREVIGEYDYIQGSPNSKKKDTYSKKNVKTKSSPEASVWDGFGRGLKTAYEPIMMFQKPFEGTLAENILKYKTGAVNIDSTRIPYDEGEGKVGHNPHPLGRVMPNIIQTEEFGDYQKFFFVGKVRDGKKTGNIHPTVKPIDLMNCLNTLVGLKGETILDPFCGSGSTGVSALQLGMDFIGYETLEEFQNISESRLNKALKDVKR